MSVHLHVRSCYTMLESTIRIPMLVKTAKEYGFSAAALTDRNTMHAAVSFYRECTEAGIQPILGMEAVCDYHDKMTPFLLLAKDNRGYRNLIQLSSLICDMRDHCTAEELIRYSDHCFLIVYGEGGWFDSELIADDRDAVTTKLQIMKDELPVFDVALSYQDAGLWKLKNAMLKRVCTQLGIRTVALNKIYYLQEKDADTYRILQGIAQQKTIQDPTLSKITGRYFLSPQRMQELYDADDLQRTEEIAAQCHADPDAVRTSLPSYPAPQSLSSAQYLTQLCLAGLKKRRNDNVTPEYTARLKKELDVIISMHYEDYFLIVYDFIREARKMDIYVGPGRGSAAGSLVAYCLGITQIDPIRYDLLFERFLNRDRVSMPDIDTDFPDDRRQDIIGYVFRRYGEDHVANIVTYGTLGARQVVRDVGKVLGISTRDLDMLVKMISSSKASTLQEALERSSRLRDVIHAEKRYEQLFAAAMQLEGLPRHTSVHAGGIVMSSRPLEDVVPTMRANEGIKTTQYSMEYLEELGLIKMDFLGLRNLSIIHSISSRIAEEDPSFNIMRIPLDDPASYDVFRRCDTVGIFQFESEGMKNLIRRMQISCFDDVVAALALFRPGPMQNITKYLENRADPSKITYPAPVLREITESTYGILIYQEQVMLTAQKVAGFSLAKADILRRAISKKHESEMIALRRDFVEGAIRNGYDKETADSLYDLIEQFANYGFNKSHAVAYGLVAYQTAYLKANHAGLFYTALLNSVIGDEVKTSQYIDECRRRGLQVLYPDVTSCESGYLFENETIRLPLSVIKGVGYNVEASIIRERENGSYEDFFDLTARLSAIGVSRAVLEKMIRAGACDSFGMGRETLVQGLDDAFNYAELVRIEHGDRITIDLGLVSKPVLIRHRESETERNDLERKALGFCLGTHPAVRRRRELELNVEPLARVTERVGVVSSFGQIERVHQHRTKKGDMMAFLHISDETGEMDVMMMPNLYSQYGNLLQRGKFIVFRGKISNDRSCILDHVRITD
ncbi:MAG: DNA polymerase III subunit alpha [Solobacterium sp.]|nr:DNA polymerase III subunit alpha [Solobacterium sp.]